MPNAPPAAGLVVMVEPSVLEIPLRIGAAAVLGAIEGAEREIDGRDAGLRTHILLATGAVIFGVISVAGFAGHGGCGGELRPQPRRL